MFDSCLSEDSHSGRRTFWGRAENVGAICCPNPPLPIRAKSPLPASAQIGGARTEEGRDSMAEDGDARNALSWCVQILGEFTVTRGHESVLLPQSSQRLLAWLAVHPRRQLRTAIAANLWPDLSQERAAGTMRTALWTLRREVEIPLRPCGGGLQLDKEATVDLWRSIDRARLLPGARHPQQSGPGSASEPTTTSDEWWTWADDFSRDLLPDWPDDWLMLHRERHRQVRLHALEDLCRVFTRMGRTAAAIEIALEAVAADPLRESAQRLLIETHLAEGNPSEAIRQFRAYERILRLNLGVAPSVELAALLPSLGRHFGQATTPLEPGRSSARPSGRAG